MLNNKKKAFWILLHVYITNNIWGRVVGVTVHCCIFIVVFLPLLLNTKPKQWLIQKVLIHSRSCWTQQHIWRMLLRNWDVPETDSRDSNNSTSFEYLYFVHSCILSTSYHPAFFRECRRVLSVRPLLSVWECTANEQIEILQKKRMVRVLTVELCCGKLDQLACLLLKSLCELLGKLFCQEFTGSC